MVEALCEPNAESLSTTTVTPTIEDGGTYALLLQQYVNRTLTLLINALPDTNQTLSAETLQQLLQTLDLALKRMECWANSKDALLIFSQPAEQTGLRHEWIHLLLRGIERARTLHDHQCEAWLLVHLGQLHQLLSEFELAKQSLSRSAELFAEEKLTNEQATAFNRLAYIATIQGDAKRARTLAEQVMVLLDPDHTEMAYCYFVLGMAARAEEEWVTAESYLRRSLELRQKNGSARQIGLALMNIGLVLRPVQRYSEAEQMYREAIVVFQRIDDSFYVAVCQVNLGNIHLSQNLYVQALTCYQEAEPIFRNLHNELRLANIYNNIGLAYAGLFKWQEAEAALTASSMRYQTLGTIVELVESLYELAKVYLQQHNHSKGKSIIRQAKRHLRHLSNNPVKQRLTTLLNELLVEISENFS